MIVSKCDNEQTNLKLRIISPLEKLHKARHNTSLYHLLYWRTTLCPNFQKHYKKLLNLIHIAKKKKKKLYQ